MFPCFRAVPGTVFPCFCVLEGRASPCFCVSVFPCFRVSVFPCFAGPPRNTAGGRPERVFSLLKNMFGADQKACLADYIQAALMLAHNKRKVG